ncbi:hypothetical protein [Streptomyces albidoflavus]|uniref:hypothetical protein n=1 Tax=Streptomyces albidoflavus TaxID=1886 RepID=UPI0004BFF543|nr:hypothetical protein [Streptomyces albidoflavus]RZE35828.1 hypothetical protein C0Q95_29795 [Streptomyces albidoflavus]WTC33817.1 hypothetical protein OH749_31595 [Streptomyces albidoflavus]
MSQPNAMDAMFGNALATRGKGAGTGTGAPTAAPATFTEPGIPAQSAESEAAPPAIETPPSTEPATEPAKGAEVAVPPIGGKAFDKKSNKGKERGPLNPAEVLRLNQAESQIRAFGKAAAAAGEAFDMIKKDGLHHHYGLTWAQYTLTHWGLSASQADRLIAAAPVMRELSIANEGTAREFVSIYREWGATSARAIWSGAKEGADGKPTAKIANIAVKGVLESTQGAKKAPAADKLSSLARKAVTRAAKEAAAAKALKAQQAAAKPAAEAVTQDAEDIVDAELVDEEAPAGDGTPWRMGEAAVRRFSDFFVAQAAKTGQEPHEVMLATLGRLQKEAEAAEAVGE